VQILVRLSKCSKPDVAAAISTSKKCLHYSSASVTGNSKPVLLHVVLLYSAVQTAKTLCVQALCCHCVLFVNVSVKFVLCVKE